MEDIGLPQPFDVHLRAPESRVCARLAGECEAALAGFRKRDKSQRGERIGVHNHAAGVDPGILQTVHQEPPLQIVTFLGVLVFLCSLVLGGWSLWQKISGQALEGFTTVILLLLLIGSILMICLGIIGYYIAKIYEEIKDRPRFIISQECGGKQDDR